MSMAAAQAAIRENFDRLPIWQQERDLALRNLLAVQAVEAYKASASPQETEILHAHRWFVEASVRAIREIIRRCPNAPCNLTVSEEIFNEAFELLDFAHVYEQVDYSMQLVNRGQNTIHVAKREPRITFAYTDEAASRRDTFLRSAEHHADRRLQSPLSAEIRHAAGAAYEHLRTIVRRDGDACTYEYDQTLFAVAGDLRDVWLQSPQYNDPLGLDPTVTLGILTMADIRRLWASLGAVHNVHMLANQVAAGGGPLQVLINLPIQSVVLLQTRQWYCDHLCRLTGLPDAMVDRFLNWHTYEIQISGHMPVMQPLVPVADRLAVPDLFMIGSNFERNFLKLLYRHPELQPIRNAVDGTKEPTAVGQLAALFPEPRFRTGRGIVIAGVTDADLCLYDTATAFLLIIQHKWLLGPDTVSESASNDERLENGVHQAVAARNHFRQDASLLRAGLNLGNLPINQVEAVVVCRGAEPTGFFEPDPTVPIIAEERFQELRTRNEPLQDLWNSLVRRPDHDRAASKATDVTTALKLAGWEFRFPGMQIAHSR